jgi:hypothetical protein
MARTLKPHALALAASLALAQPAVAGVSPAELVAAGMPADLADFASAVSASEGSCLGSGGNSKAA